MYTHKKTRSCLIFPCGDALLGSLSGKQEASGFVGNPGLLSPHYTPQHPVWARVGGAAPTPRVLHPSAHRAGLQSYRGVQTRKAKRSRNGNCIIY